MIKADQEDQLQDALGAKYQVLCRIGGGGMAQVYLARHRLHGGLFAIKVLADHLAQDPSIVSRFEGEARMAASLASHPNIVPIFDIGEGNGLHYLIMQFIAGEDLCSLTAREGRLSPAAAANVIAQAAEALSSAEARHIVHRDIKLANMLLDEGGRIKLLDFGISKITDVADGLTRPGESLGTPFYMSPEQIRGEPCDIRSDLYSLGVVFFELLTGRRPFENQSVTAVHIAHLSTPPPLLLNLDPALPPACESITQKLLAKRREDRYQGTAELLADLATHGANPSPSQLRPCINPALLRAIQTPAEPCTPSNTDPASSPTTPVPARATPIPRSQLAGVSTPPPPSPSHQAAPSPAEAIVPAAPVIEVAEPPAGRLPAAMAASGLVLLLILAAAAGSMLLRPRHPNRLLSTVAHSQSLPFTLSDSHGRMLLIPRGPFLYNPGTEPQRLVTLPSFYLDETEVSNAEYARFCQATGHPIPHTPSFLTAPDQPVTGVSHQDAAAYAAWAGKRLPSEQEWEKAARGSADGRPFPWGFEPWTTNVPAELQPVTSHPLRRSPFGAYNMAGNVWEWTASLYPHTSVEDAKLRQLTGGKSFSQTWFIAKGGSFAPGGSADFAVNHRRGLPVDANSPWVGFRCVRDAPAPAS